MPLTLLFDLDDTLLSNDINTFLPVYLKALGKHLVEVVSPEKMIPQLLAATDKMQQNSNPGLTLEKAFDAHFYPAIGSTKQNLTDTLERFYDEVFPSLHASTSRRPAALDLVQTASGQGHTLVVATNPLFPRKAILHRLRWAGLPPEKMPFRLITSYESFHFAKPNPAFYAEVLAQLGWPDQPVGIVGNSLEHDLLPAAQLGIPGFWVDTSTEPLPEGLPSPSAKGSLEEVLPWIASLEAAAPAVKPQSPAGLMAIIKSTPSAIDTLVQQLSEPEWQQRPETNEWCITEILCHLRDVDLEINLPRMQKVAAGDNPFLPGINSDTWTDERKYCQQDGLTALNAFIEARSSLIHCLENLAPEAWSLPARHAIFGPTNLRELVSFITTHDRSHIQQVVSAARQLHKNQAPL